MEKVYVTEGELKALDDSIETHRHKQLDLDSGKKSIVTCLSRDCMCCVHAGPLPTGAPNCKKCAIGKAGHKGCKGIGWRNIMKKKEHKVLLDKLIEIRGHCVIKKTKKFRCSICGYMLTDTEIECSRYDYGCPNCGVSFNNTYPYEVEIKVNNHGGM